MLMPATPSYKHQQLICSTYHQMGERGIEGTGGVEAVVGGTTEAAGGFGSQGNSLHHHAVLTLDWEGRVLLLSSEPSSPDGTLSGNFYLGFLSINITAMLFQSTSL